MLNSTPVRTRRSGCAVTESLGIVLHILTGQSGGSPWRYLVAA